MFTTSFEKLSETRREVAKLMSRARGKLYGGVPGVFANEYRYELSKVPVSKQDIAANGGKKYRALKKKLSEKVDIGSAEFGDYRDLKDMEKVSKAKQPKIDTVFAMTGFKKEEKPERDMVSVKTKKDEDTSGFARNIESRMGNE